MMELAGAVQAGEWPHTMDAQVWVRQWKEALAENPNIASDDATMIGWFANAIMAGYDTAMMKSNDKLATRGPRTPH